MIPCVPDPYPDELLYSIWARYSDRVQYPNKVSVLNELFGNGHVKPIIDMPCHLTHFVDHLPHGQKYTADYFIDRHTLLPFYSPFLPQERLTHIREQMLTHNTSGLHRRTGIGTGHKHLSPNWLRYCPLCVKEERENHGESYWHRLHQLPGVEICSTHMVFLENSTIRARQGLNGLGIFSAQSTIRNITPHTATSSPFFNTLMEIANDAQYLLEYPLSPRESLFFRQQYHSLLAQEGFMAQSGQLRAKDFLKTFTEYYSQELLTSLQCDMKKSVPPSYTWLARIAGLEGPNFHPGAHHPLQHILAIRFLHMSVEEFFRKNLKTPLHFGPGPWPCLNPVCDHYRQENIFSYQLAKVKIKGRIVGIFTCSCGFTYSRRGPDASPDDVFRKNNILSYGDLWEAKLREFWSDPTVSYNDIANHLGISRSSVRSHAVRLHLAIPRGSSTFSQSERTQKKAKKDFAEYRSKWLTILKEAPEEPKYKLRRRAKGVYSWLYRYDHEWLLAHSPSRNTAIQSRVQKSTAMHNKQKQEDALNRDTLIAETIRNVAGRLMNASGAPKRVSIAIICREIPQLRSRIKSNESTLIRQAFQEVVESFEAFAVRRIKYVLQKYIEEQVIPTRLKLLRRANLHKEILQNPLVQQTLDEALLIVSQLR